MPTPIKARSSKACGRDLRCFGIEAANKLMYGKSEVQGLDAEGFDAGARGPSLAFAAQRPASNATWHTGRLDSGARALSKDASACYRQATCRHNTAALLFHTGHLNWARRWVAVRTCLCICERERARARERERKRERERERSS